MLRNYFTPKVINVENKLRKDLMIEYYLLVTCGGKTLEAKALRNISANSALNPPIPRD